jgi:hypothetical protein
MTSADLPSDWARRPVTDPAVFAGVIDLISAPAHRARGAVHLLITQPDGRMLHPVTIDEAPPGSPGPGATTTWQRLLQELASQGARHLVIVVSRPRPARRSPDDDALLTLLTGAAAGAGLDLLGCAVATPDGVVVLDGDDLGGPDGFARPA